MQPNTTDTTPETRNDAKQKGETNPQRGVRLLTVKRASPWGVQWRENGKVRTQFFSTEKQRNERADEVRKAKSKGVSPLTRGEMKDWAAFRAAVNGADWRDVVHGWRSWLESRGQAPSTATVKEVVSEYVKGLKQRLDRGELAKVTYKKNEPKAQAFAKSFDDLSVSKITGEEIEEWIDDRGFEAAETFNTYRKVLHAVFATCSKELPNNPVDDVKPRSDAAEEVGILTVDEAVRLFAYAKLHAKDLVPRLALEAFAGLRFSSAFRLEKDDINFSDSGILLPAHKLKTGRRHYIDGLPKNLWKWLKLETAATWVMTPREYRRDKSKLFTDAKVPHPHNCLRHSFCTYHVSAFKDPGKTATILCHRDQQLLWSRYNGRATQRDGQAYFEIGPSTQ